MSRSDCPLSQVGSFPNCLCIQVACGQAPLIVVIAMTMPINNYFLKQLDTVFLWVASWGDTPCIGEIAYGIYNFPVEIGISATAPDFAWLGAAIGDAC